HPTFHERLVNQKNRHFSLKKSINETGLINGQKLWRETFSMAGRRKTNAFQNSSGYWFVYLCVENLRKIVTF
ncbi:MAG: hypothetical protein M0P26_05450, partial [Bacteroidales bacterium]|nr:hypothetical protein [Bacteroidales bacterium]